MPTLSNKQWLMMGVTLVIYSFMMGWQLAIAVVFTIAFHEYCHLMMAHKLGMKTQGFMMIPFIGGMAFVPSGYKTLWRQAQVVFAGPIGGGLMSFITFGIYLLTGNPFFGGVAFWMGVLNLFNLFPISFMDGGLLMNCITYSINRKMGLYLMAASTVIGTLGIACINPVLSIFVFIFGFAHCRREYNNQKNMESGKSWLCTQDFRNKPFPMDKKEITKVALIWFSSVLILGIYCFILYHSPLSNFTTLFAR